MRIFAPANRLSGMRVGPPLLAIVFCAAVFADEPGPPASNVWDSLARLPSPTDCPRIDLSDQRRALLHEAAGLAWDPYGAPTSCMLALSARCSPDLDGDGALDLQVHFRWSVPYDDDAVSGASCERGGRYFEAGGTVLFSRPKDSWKALGLVAQTASDGQNEISADLSWIRLSDGQIGIEVRSCNVGLGYQSLYIWRGKLVEMATRQVRCSQ